MNDKNLEEIKNDMRQVMLHTIAGIGVELPEDPIDIEIRFENRQITMKLDHEQFTLEESMLASRAFDKVEEKAQKHSSNTEKAVREQTGAVAQYREEEMDDEPFKTDEVRDVEFRESGAPAKDAILNS